MPEQNPINSNSIPFLWPNSIRKGFEIVHGEYISAQEIEAFLARWGSISNETFLRILSEGEGIDRVIAITAPGYSELPHIREHLLPFLHSTNHRNGG